MYMYYNNTTINDSPRCAHSMRRLYSSARVLTTGWTAAALLSLALLCLAAPLQAATLTWDDGGAGSLWATADNWDPAQVPDDTDFDGLDDVLINPTSTGTSATIDQDYTIGTFRVTQPQSGSPITVTHSISINSGRTLTITGDYRQGIGSPDCPNAGDCTNHNTDITVSGDGTLAFDNSSGTFQAGVWSGNWNRGDRVD